MSQVNQKAFWDGFCKASVSLGVDPRYLWKLAGDTALAGPRGAGGFSQPKGPVGPPPNPGAPEAPIAPAPGFHLGGQLTGGAAINYDQQMAADRQQRGVDQFGRQLPFNQRQ